MIATVRYKGKDVEVVIDDQDADLFHAHRWYIMTHTYKSGKTKRYLIRRTPERRTVYFHREALGITDRRIDVDHKDNDGLNNLRSNIRTATRQQNRQNITANHGSTSRYKGVCWHKASGKWIARYGYRTKVFYLGAFEDEVEAARAYDEAVRPLHGAFFRPNLPEEATT